MSAVPLVIEPHLGVPANDCLIRRSSVGERFAFPGIVCFLRIPRRMVSNCHMSEIYRHSRSYSVPVS